MKLRLLIVILSATCATHTQSVRAVPVHLDATASIPSAIHFFCTNSYDSQACLKDSVALRYALASYPLKRLGTWSFLLVPVDDWRTLMRGLHLDPASPAFSNIDHHIIVLESSLITSSPIRDKNLLRTFGMIGNTLLDLVVTHELGHSICQDGDERRAEDHARELRRTKTVNCTKTPEGR